MPDLNGAPPAADQLQFEKAEFVPAQPELCCAFCKSSISNSYYRVAGEVTCTSCAERRRAFQTPPQGKGIFIRAALYGLGAAVLGSIIYALISLTGFQFSIVAIAVGVLVGKAIRHVTRGRSSRRYQVLAVLLTYGAITTSYIPGIVGEALQKEKSTVARPAPIASQKSFHPVRVAGALVMLIGVTFVIQFLVLLSQPASGLINLVIIAIGLLQAWRLSRPDRAPILGPYLANQPSAG